MLDITENQVLLSRKPQDLMVPNLEACIAFVLFCREFKIVGHVMPSFYRSRGSMKNLADWLGKHLESPVKFEIFGGANRLTQLAFIEWLGANPKLINIKPVVFHPETTMDEREQKPQSDHGSDQCLHLRIEKNDVIVSIDAPVLGLKNPFLDAHRLEFREG